MTDTNTKQSPLANGSWLVQRLDPPLGGSVLGRDNPFAFGGGYKNGGLTDEAMDLIRDIWSFDYMGAAEFEFGAVPKALQGLAEDQERLRGYEVVLDGGTSVYFLCREEHRDAVQERIVKWSDEDYPLMKESLNLKRRINRAEDDDYPRTEGWLELDNGFLFFVNEDMWRKACALFGVEV